MLECLDWICRERLLEPGAAGAAVATGMAEREGIQ